MIAHRALPTPDPFSFTMAGAPWVAHEWLAELVMAGIQGSLGWAGLALVTALLFALSILLLTQALRRRFEPLTGLVLVIRRGERPKRAEALHGCEIGANPLGSAPFHEKRFAASGGLFFFLMIMGFMAMILDMLDVGLVGMLMRVQPVPGRQVGVMGGLFMIARLVMIRRLVVMLGGFFVMFGREPVMFSAFVSHRHDLCAP